MEGLKPENWADFCWWPKEDPNAGSQALTQYTKYFSKPSPKTAIKFVKVNIEDNRYFSVTRNNE